MAQKAVVDAVPLSGGVRRTRDADPFFVGDGELTHAKNGVFTLEGGFLQLGGVTPILASALDDGGEPSWMWRWYRTSGESNPFIVLSSGGTLYVSDTEPTAETATLSVAQDDTSGTPGDITGLSSEYFTPVVHSGWLYLYPSDPASDEIYRYDGTYFYQVTLPAPGSAPSGFTYPAGNLVDGVYGFKYTYVYGDDEECGESDPSPGANATVSGGPKGVSLSVTASTRPDVSAIRIYRTLVGQSIYYFVAEVDNTAGPHTVTAADAELSSANYELEDDHSGPPTGARSGIAHLNRTFVVTDDPKNRVYISIVDQPDVFPLTAGFYMDDLATEMTSKLVSFFSLNGNLYATAPEGTWILRGDRNENFYWSRVPGNTGFISERSVSPGQKEVFGLGAKDILYFDGISMKRVDNAKGYVLSANQTLLKDAQGIYRDEKYHVAVKSADTSEFDRIVVVNRDPTPAAPNGMAVSTIESEYFPDTSDYSNIADFKITSLCAWLHESERIFVGMDDGYIYELDRGYSIAREGEDSAGVEFDVKTGWFFPSGPYSESTFMEAWAAIEDDGSGGTITLSWEIMTDDLDEFVEGSVDIELHSDDPGESGVLVGRWDESRWGSE